MDNFNKPSQKYKMDIVDIEKLRAQHEAGLSIRKLSIIWNIPYVSLYRALKKVDKDKEKVKNGQ